MILSSAALNYGGPGGTAIKSPFVFEENTELKGEFSFHGISYDNNGEVQSIITDLNNSYIVPAGKDFYLTQARSLCYIDGVPISSGNGLNITGSGYATTLGRIIKVEAGSVITGSGNITPSINGYLVDEDYFH